METQIHRVLAVFHENTGNPTVACPRVQPALWKPSLARALLRTTPATQRSAGAAWCGSLVSGGQSQPDSASAGPEELLSAPEIAARMMLSAAGDDDAKTLVIQQEQLEQLSVQALRDAGMGRPVASSWAQSPWGRGARRKSKPSRSTMRASCSARRGCSTQEGQPGQGKGLSESRMSLPVDICLHLD